VAAVESVSAIKKLLEALSAENLSPQFVENKAESRDDDKKKMVVDDTPASRLEMKSSIPAGSLLKSNILAFKDGAPQLLRPNAFKNTTEAVLALVFAVESGLKSPKIDYESFKGLFESQNIKSGSPLSMLLNNLKNSGYLDKKAYDTDRTVVLSARGEQKAIEVLQGAGAKKT
jgi:hypothetical protein